MGRTRESKEQLVAEITEGLAGADMVLVMDYKGLSVAEITQLRDGLAESDAKCTIAKNTLVKKAIEGSEEWSELGSMLKGTNALLLAKGDVGSAVKAYQKFQKATKKTEIRGGVFEGKLLSQADIKAIAEMPSKEELYAQIAGATNSIVANIAILVKEIPTGVARAVNAVAEKNAA